MQYRTSLTYRRVFISVATVAGVLCVAMLAIASILERSATLSKGDPVMYVAPGIDGRNEWQGPATITEVTRDGRVAVEDDGQTVMLDLHQAIPLEVYRSRPQ